jgi:tetratricopeptide (TPR) repeat protein
MFRGKAKRLVAGISILGAVCVSGVVVGEDLKFLFWEYWDKKIEKDPTNAEAYWQRGKSRALARNYSEAIKDFDKAIELGSQNGDLCTIGPGAKRTEKCPIVFQHRGDAKYALKQYSDAIKDYDKAIELQEPGSVLIGDVYLSRAKAKFNLKQNT